VGSLTIASHEPDRVVLVKWDDSDAEHGWLTADQVAAGAECPLACETVGYVVAESERVLVVASTRGDNGDVLGVVRIPRVAVTSLEDVLLPIEGAAEWSEPGGPASSGPEPSGQAPVVVALDEVASAIRVWTEMLGEGLNTAGPEGVAAAMARWLGARQRMARSS
jgi:hypothetical protein